MPDLRHVYALGHRPLVTPDALGARQNRVGSEKQPHAWEGSNVTFDCW